MINLPDVNFGETSPKGDGSELCTFVGGTEGDSVIGIHLLLLGDLLFGLWTGSNSKLRFRVAQAIFATEQ